MVNKQKKINFIITNRYLLITCNKVALSTIFKNPKQVTIDISILVRP